MNKCSITASVLEKGIVDKTGLLKEPYFENGIEAELENKKEKIWIGHPNRFPSIQNIPCIHWTDIRQKARIFTIILLFIAAVTTAFAARNPMGLINGMKLIVISRDALITDYFELTGYGAALVFRNSYTLYIFLERKAPSPAERLPHSGQPLTRWTLFLWFWELPFMPGYIIQNWAVTYIPHCSKL